MVIWGVIANEKLTMYSDAFRFARHPPGLAISKGKNVRIAPHTASLGLALIACLS